MKYISCTILTFSAPGEECWILSVPKDTVKAASDEVSGLLVGHTKQIVFSDCNASLTVTTDYVSLHGRQVRITKTWLECLERLFSEMHTDHIDYDFSDMHGDVSITVKIV